MREYHLHTPSAARHEFTQPRDHSLAEPCIVCTSETKFLGSMCSILYSHSVHECISQGEHFGCVECRECAEQRVCSESSVLNFAAFIPFRFADFSFLNSLQKFPCSRSHGRGCQEGEVTLSGFFNTGLTYQKYGF